MFTKSSNPKSGIFARRAMFFVALAGLFVSSYLLVVYTSGGPIVCGVSHGCDAVRLSEWSHLYGIPTPLLGVIFYTGMAAILIVRTVAPSFKTKLLHRLTLLGVFIGISESAYLTSIQAFKIGQYCSWCLASAVAAVLIFIIALLDRADVPEEGRAIKELKIQFFSLLVAVVVGTIAIIILTAPQTDGEMPVYQPPEISEEAERKAMELLAPAGLTYEGPEDAAVTVTEFIDFECTACASAHPEIAKVREAFAGRIRFAYRNFPLPMYPHSKDAALAAVCADAQGMLFPYADTLIENRTHLEREDLIRYAAELRLNLDDFVPCLTSQDARLTVERDLHNGDALGVEVTPTIFVNASMIDGLPNAEQLGEIIDQHLSEE